MNNLFSWVGCLCLTVSLVGCGGEGPSGTVAGTVTMEGKPVAAQISFKGDNAAASGTSDASGNFQMMSGPNATVPIGKYRVSVTDVSSSVSSEGADYEAMMTSGQPAAAPKSTIPAKYQAFGTSELEFEVTEGENTFNIALE
ncbi:hypothetical protein Poly24_50860 [Rosistilla carotiformis]|uniref:Carboxypeptidase regulatory-like domain-containing protein n=1 Tax=Rosistilla carotiformis TaxID=2528017 RepID=A0A518K0P3_9BACT|nr:hypothetical protein [Rosistilla carotiformis]QDV71351.1 hypothetical protein Poly24_50860 [Rosistilla carotiformis]